MIITLLKSSRFGMFAFTHFMLLNLPFAPLKSLFRLIAADAVRITET
jgi:hypothetical protein